MRTEAAPTIYRGDYRPPAYRVETVELHFNLDPESTEVRSRLRCVRNPAAPAGPLQLLGEDLETVSVVVDGHPLSAEALPGRTGRLELAITGDEALVEVLTRISPARNTALSGLYLSRGGFFTQCEAEGFRRITWFPDRPDVMSRFTVTLEGDARTCPVLLSNGNLVEQGSLPGGRHFARWEDPFPKPCYLFALVAADLVCQEERIRTASGREALLQVWVEAGNLDRTAHAMASLIHSIRWDEATYGLELDLDRFMIVAVSDFNMGAMENKGLNIFNAKYVLANPDTATDVDYDNVESIVAHEYFHNWTGNRVTCRDWFQLTLKEGLTVFRDQQFSMDMMARAGGESARAVKRIDDVRTLRAAQFPEDAGPMAHPIRPDSYQEINNFYTATVYEKGAEVIRMLHTLLGAEGFRRGMDLYFQRHDGQAVTCDDFVAAMADANGRDLGHFMGWYRQAGTPRLRAAGRWEPAGGRYVLELSQSTPATAGQPDKKPVVIPVAVGLIGPDGEDLPLRLAGEAMATGTTRLLELSTVSETFVFEGLTAQPVPSLLRGFSAPVVLEVEESEAQLAFRMAHDSDPFNRWEAGQRYMERTVLTLAATAAAGGEPVVPSLLVAAFRRLLDDPALAPAYLAVAAGLPSENYLLERMAPADPVALRQALIHLISTLGRELADDWLKLYEANAVDGPYRFHPADAGKRSLRNLALRMLAAAGVEEGYRLAAAQYERGANMTERFGALTALVQSGSPNREAALADFHDRFQHDAIVLDKWLALQAGTWRWRSGAPGALETVRHLVSHPAFQITNPNKVYALLGTFFRANPGEFHRSDGAGYDFWAEQVLALDPRNPQVAARMARALERWTHFVPDLQARILPALERVAAADQLSADVREVVAKALG